MAHALVRGDARMLDDPLRGQSLSLTAGCVLAVIGLAVCAVLAVLQPRGRLGAEPVVVVRGSGALYVRIGETVHPVLNLASARLIAGSPVEPTPVSPSALDGVRRGPMVGIPGAPDTIADPLSRDESGWTLCEDAAGTTTVAVGPMPDRLDSRRGVLVTPRGESVATTYLLYDGRRARVDLRNHAVVRALKLDHIAPRAVSRSLLDAIPETAEITGVGVPNAGTSSMVRGLVVGTVVRVLRSDTSEYYVVLAHGVQRIGEVAADLIRFSAPGGRREIVTVAPSVIGSAPIANTLAVATLPEKAGVSVDPVLCAHWDGSNTSVKSSVLTGDSPPWDGMALSLAQADGPGPGVDAVVVPHGRSAYVRAVGITGDGAANGARYLLSDSGVVFGIHDEQTGKRLGLSDAPLPAPWPVLAWLPRGPELRVESASIVRDVLGAPA